jgi:hypothetical protein
MWHASVSRETLLGISRDDSGIASLVDSRIIELDDVSADRLNAPSGTNAHLFWDRDPREVPRLPTLICVGDGRLVDFLAWSATYLPVIRPLTGMCRVLEWRSVLQLSFARQRPTLRRRAAALIGLAIGEAINAGDETAPDRASRHLNVQNTLAYVLARSHAIGGASQMKAVGERWLRTRDILQRSQLNRGYVDYVIAILGILTDVRDVADGAAAELIGHACNEIESSGSVTERTWRYLVRDNTFELNLLLTREDQVRELERAIRDFPRIRDLDFFTRSFAIAVQLARISAGTLDHASLLVPYRHEFPFALLWYGALAGLHPRSRVLSARAGTGYRALRDLERATCIVDAPTSDISSVELEMFAEAGAAYETGLVQVRGITVELLPFVSCAFKGFARDDNSAAPAATQPRLFGGTDPAETGRKLSEMRTLLRRMIELSRAIDPTGGGEDPDPEPDRRRRKRR